MVEVTGSGSNPDFSAPIRENTLNNPDVCKMLHMLPGEKTAVLVIGYTTIQDEPRFFPVDFENDQDINDAKKENVQIIIVNSSDEFEAEILRLKSEDNSAISLYGPKALVLKKYNDNVVEIGLITKASLQAPHKTHRIDVKQGTRVIKEGSGTREIKTLTVTDMWVTDK